ncbi:hypothetical protein F5Y13DRAFT_205906 [Hypoxylon sp. FL1857]|nr:hypothetical protein F5Y13DRAFT_205906 [Hypoxylon sp. FL1857]
MPRGNRSSEASQGSPPDRRSEGTSSRHRSRRRRGMPEDERRARQQRRHRLQGRASPRDEDEEMKGEGSEAVGLDISQEATEQEIDTNEPILTESEISHERKPWETIAIGHLGDNLSHIEKKDREIERHLYIVQYHEKNSPHQVPHNQAILEKLIKERLEMDDNEENNMPEDQREEKNRISERLEMLNWALDTCQCNDEEVNIRAAIQGYQSGDIPYSCNFTLIYAGHLVDFCPTYQSFCEDRKERLDRYYARFGPGWLWHEPPLADSGCEALAKKGVCLTRMRGRSSYNIGHYPVHQKFTVDKFLVMKGKVNPRQVNVDGSKPYEFPVSPVSCVIETVLDSGATYPVLPAEDLNLFGISMRWYPSQGVMTLSTVTGRSAHRFFEMCVSVCSADGESLVGDQGVWPGVPQIGGICPVMINPTKATELGSLDRISGMLPFESCYMSSAPTTFELWLGEDRRDVLGARRLPAHMRWSPEVLIRMKYSKEFVRLRESVKTPDQVIFIHKLDDEGRRTFVDQDCPGVRGKSELAIMEKQVDKSTQRLVTRKTKNVIIEPREGEHKELERISRHGWRNEFLTTGEMLSKSYRDVGDKVPEKPQGANLGGHY